MRLRMWNIAGFAAFTLMAANAVAAYTERELHDPFDPAHLTRQELRVVQLALAFYGDYTALLDGEWGRGSQSALERHAVRSNVDLPPKNWFVAAIVAMYEEPFRQEGWSHTSFGPISFLVPAETVTDTRSNFVLQFRHLRSSLAYTVAYPTYAEMQDDHDLVLYWSGVETPYTLRRDNLWITSITETSGDVHYLRSDYVDGIWAQVLISTTAADRNLLNMVAGSIMRGPPVDLTLPAYGVLATGIRTLDAVLTRENVAGALNTAPAPLSEVEPTSASETPPDAYPTTIGSGTGFVVSAQGHVLTNAHVVNGCTTVTVEGRDATLLAEDDTFDLALLDTGTPSLSPAVFALRPIGLNADIVAAGYPLQGLLSGLNVTRGSITAERGLGGDSTRMQISAPVQPGNSGGPVLAADGTIVGVVVSKLDAGYVAEMTGDIPQNVNFAIRGEMAQFFLMQNGVIPLTTEPLPRLAPEILAERAQEITRLIECQ